MRRLIAVPLAVPLVALVAGCGETVIDQGKAEDLARQIADSGTVKTKSISCPKDVKAKKGADFDCQIEWTDGTKGSITIHQEDDKGHIATSGKDLRVQGQ